MALKLRFVVLASSMAFTVGCTCSNEVQIGGTGGSGTGTGGNAGTGGNIGTGGNVGTGGTGGTGGGLGGAGGGAVFFDDGGNFEPDDAGPLPYYDGGCGAIDAGNPPYLRRCGPTTLNECDGLTDQFLTSRGVPAALLNGPTGNGYDDDCDGIVDEACPCPSNGQTKDCYLVPATQANPATKQPVGWCIPNAKGTVDCSGGELTAWSGLCRGASQPQRWDSCAPGDFNCDGLSGNNATSGCMCTPDVACPTTELQFAPFPAPAAIPLVDGSLWIDAPKRALATGWTWTVLGGDCDNVLPFPTFALYNQANSAAANARKGARQPVKFDSTLSKYIVMAGEPLIGIVAAAFGNGVAGGQLYPAFALSGDYTLQGEFDLDGKHHVCTQKVRVRAPGVRAELCWDTVGGLPTGTPGNDIDLHFARLQGISCAEQGWDNTCALNAIGRYQDCSYSPGSGCPTGTNVPGWGYLNSPNAACQGWGSKRGAGACTNPRLDRDNVTCNRTLDDPNAANFCGPENINIDNPKDNDRFVIGVNHYANRVSNPNAKPHVNVYCNGARVLSIGYNPAAGQTMFPLLTKPGSDSTGDFWTAAIVTAHLDGGVLSSCDVETVPSHGADPTRDGPSPDGGGNALCVDSTMNLTPTPNQYNYASHKFVDPGSKQGGAAPGSQPLNAAQFCKH